VSGHASRRCLAGNYVEELLAAVLDARVLKTDARCAICPDAQAGDVFYEFKANLKGNPDVTIYLHRLRKEAEFAKEHRFHYGVLEYDADFTDADTCDKVYRAMTQGVVRVLVVTAEEIHQLARVKTLSVAGLRDDVGWQCRGYERGYYRVNLKEVRGLCDIGQFEGFEVHGMRGMTHVWQSHKAREEREI